MTSSSDASRNRAFWDQASDEYHQRHGEFITRTEPAWGVWQLPESDLRVLGDVAGKDVLELGCGAAHWSILLARRGARVVGLDNSPRQLERAREALAAAGLEFQLVQAQAVVRRDRLLYLLYGDARRLVILSDVAYSILRQHL